MNEVLKLSPEAQQTLMQMQNFQQQMQTVHYQREALTYQKIEAEKALVELKKLKDKDEVFKAVGPILIKSKKSDLEKELSEKMETANVRLKSLDKQEETIRKKAEDVQKKLETILKGPDKAEAN